MIDENLLNKFNQIQDLPVSEEMLGAYIEGNLSEAEIGDIELIFQYKPNLSMLYNEVSNPIDYNSQLSDEYDSVAALIFENACEGIYNSDSIGSGLYDLDFELPFVENNANSINFDSTNDNQLDVSGMNLDPIDFNI